MVWGVHTEAGTGVMKKVPGQEGEMSLGGGVAAFFRIAASRAPPVSDHGRGQAHRDYARRPAFLSPQEHRLLYEGTGLRAQLLP
jgi:hypothetical protein